MSRIVSFVVLLAIVVVVGALAFKVMASFLLPMFLAVVLVVIFRPLHKWFLARCRGYDRVAAGLTTAAILLIVLIPTVLILVRAAAEAYALATEVNPEEYRERLGKLRQRFNLETPEPGPAVDDLLKSLDSNVKDLESIDSGAEQKDPAPHIAAIVTDAQQIHDALGLGNPPDRPGPLTPELHQKVAAAWQPLENNVTTFAQQKQGTREFSNALIEVSSSLRSFRDALLGTPMMQWIRQQLDPDTDQIHALQTQVKEAATGFAVGTGQAVGGFLGGLVVGIGVMTLSLYYFLADGPTMIRAVMQLSPLDDRYEEELLNEFTTISRAVVLATLLSAFAQGLLASIGYFFAGFESVFLLTVVTMLLAMIPFVGAAAVWGACSVWLFFENHIFEAVGLAIYGGLIVSMIDNLIKPMVLHGQSKLHPLLALLSILGGIKALGPIGIFVGPMGVGFLQALLNMLHNELRAMGDSEIATTPPPTKPAPTPT